MRLSFTLFIGFMLFAGFACSQKSKDKNTETDTGSNSESKISAVMPSTMFVGTYTRKEGHVDGKAEGIYKVYINTGTGTLEFGETAAEITNPSFLALSPDGNNLYAVSELTGQNEEATGFIFAFEILDDNSLKQIDQIPSNGLAPAHVSLDQTGTLLFAANYLGGVVTVYNRLSNGTLEMRQQLDHTGSGPHPEQDSSHPHMVKVSPDNKFVFIPDKGADKIWSYKIDLEAKKLTPTEQGSISVQDGAGPRHMDFHPSGKYAYVINELDNTINVFAYNKANGSLIGKQSATTIPMGSGISNSAADIHVHPSGKYLYGSNRGHNNIVAYSINQKNGMITVLGYAPTKGESPRNFNISPTGNYLYAANQNTDTIVLFEINKETGALKYTEHKLDIKTPVSIVFGK